VAEEQWTDTILSVIGFLCQCIFPIALIVLGAISGTLIEQAHFRNIAKREAETANIASTDLKVFLAGTEPRAGGALVTSEVVIAGDALKNFIAYFNKLVGGEISVYETLMRRARREATLRLKESARAKGYNALANLRIENCDIGMMTGKGKPVSVAVVACATAYRLRSLE
jgi:uncharacterized protein YbjQ (UPF0145 family)